MQNKFFFIVSFLFLSLCSFADTTGILTEYRNNGIVNVQKKMDNALASQKYWNQYLKDKNTEFGYIEKYKNVLVCNKEKSTLALYSKTEDGTYKLQKEYSAFTGKSKGDKVREGDLRTPIGIYNITKKISKVDSFYGPMAFVTSYPNTYDKYKGKNGSGIWIHGLPTEQERDEYTKGCIAINNQSIECLDRHIHIDETVLIINKDSVKTDISKEKLSKLLSLLYRWRYTWIYNDIENYLAFYDTKFVRFDGMHLERFKAYKTRIFNKNEEKEIIFNDLNVIPYPNNNNLFKISFNEKYKSNSFSFTGDKVLIVRLENNTMKIITEK